MIQRFSLERVTLVQIEFGLNFNQVTIIIDIDLRNFHHKSVRMTNEKEAGKFFNRQPDETVCLFE